MWCLNIEFAVGEKPALELSGLSPAAFKVWTVPLQQAYLLLLGFSCSEFIDLPGRTNLNCMNDMTFRFLGTPLFKIYFCSSLPAPLPESLLCASRCA